MDKKEKAQILADQIQPLLMFIDSLAESIEDDEIELLRESKEVLLNHIRHQHSAMTLTMAFGIETDTTDEEYKAKTLDILIELIKLRKDYKNALISIEKDRLTKEKNRAELLKIFGNL